MLDNEQGLKGSGGDFISSENIGNLISLLFGFLHWLIYNSIFSFGWLTQPLWIKIRSVEIIAMELGPS